MTYRNFSTRFLVQGFLSLVVLVLVLAVSGRWPFQPQSGDTTEPARAFADIYKQRAPGVVSIQSSRTVVPPRLLVPQFPFFGFPEYFPPVEARASGSGFFISADGYILTNDHVVAGADQVRVVLPDQRQLRARLAGRDAASDLALLKVEGADFPFVEMDSARPRVGDWVIAIGNPFDLGSTATAGIVSAYGRNIGSGGVEYMQLDAPLNQGSSGGPAFDVRGRVVGVNTAILSPNGGFIGIGFALPADHARRVAQRLMRVDRGRAGSLRDRLQQALRGI